MENYLEVIKRIIEESDLVLEILDARFVELSRNEEIEGLVKEIGRPLIFVVNKSDLVSKKSIKKQIKKLKKSEVVYISSKRKSSRKILFSVIKRVFKKYGKRKISEEKKKKREAKADIVVGVVGYPNVGKSSIINLMARRKKAKIEKKAGTTHGIQWIRATKEIKFLDSPGIIPLKKEDELRHGLIGAKDPEKLKDPEKVCIEIIKLFLKYNKKAFERVLKMKITTQDPYLILEQIAEKRKYLLKKGKLDKYRAACTLIREWQHGKLKL